MVAKNLSLTKVALLGVFLTLALISMNVEARRGVALGGDYQNQAYAAQFNKGNSPYGIRNNLKEFTQANYQQVNSQYGVQNLQQDLQENSAYKVLNQPHGRVIQQAPVMHHETGMYHAAPHSVVDVAPVRHSHSIVEPVAFAHHNVVEEVMIPVRETVIEIVPLTLAQEKEREHNIKCHNDPTFIHDFSLMDCD
jgi:hypothetical protein